jgi:hypothetical protein
MGKRAARKYQERKDATARANAALDEQDRRAGDHRYEHAGRRKGWVRRPGKGGR